MTFASLEFWLFLVGTVAVFAVIPQAWRLVFLVLASLVHYGSYGWTNLIYLGFVVTVAIGAVALARHADMRTATTAGALCLTAVLAAFKAGLGQSWGLSAPAGYSFYSFAAIAYLIDSGRALSMPATAPSTVQGNAAIFALVWFPKLFAGPITRSRDLAGQIEKGLRLAPSGLQIGGLLILGGLLKKLVIADNLALVVDPAFAIPDYAAPLELLIATYFFAFQIYCDFSGYTDLALGLSLIFGLALPPNFAKPYLCASVGRFWAECWHITLGKWFRDYVFIPLGGSRAGRLRTVVNLMTVFALSGLWHSGLGYGAGAGFVVWGLLNGAFVAIEQALPDAPKTRIVTALRVLITFHLILLTWVFFRAGDLDDAFTILRRVSLALPSATGVLAQYPFTTQHFIGAGLIVGLLLAEVITGNVALHRRVLALPRPARWSLVYAGMALLLLLGRWQATTFIYMQF